MNKISEREVCQKTFLNKKSLYWWLSILLILVLFSLTAVITWGYGFKGFLYIEYKNKTDIYYKQIVLNVEQKDSCSGIEKETNNFKSQCINMKEEIINYYDSQAGNDLVIKYISIYTIESISSKNHMIFSVTNTFFEDIRYKNEEDKSEALMKTIFFIYSKEDNEWKLDDLLFKNKHIEKIGDYQ
ncbi:hypothetical protein [Spiroplasma diminutum]|uniref:Transmembrane protein n=1 Tax=Spiroplasma diminutum CUAS-1 TaxID=1276221 RepID=S5MEM9_9MOLU|nr:hypothetical protein [Spiroplasma diminutum]AGR42203.1 hypothetical protein SDIMI_v3c04990 [Spiroplasma diminutum CUAS-1]